jgi:hypothetical protein
MTLISRVHGRSRSDLHNTADDYAKPGDKKGMEAAQQKK